MDFSAATSQNPKTTQTLERVPGRTRGSARRARQKVYGDCLAGAKLSTAGRQQDQRQALSSTTG